MRIRECQITMEALCGGMIKAIKHMHDLLTDHPLGYTWYNYARRWETDHIWSFQKMNPRNISHRFKVNHYTNLCPRDPPSNNSRRYQR